MERNYSIPRRIWRILYPPLVLIAVQIIVTATVFALSLDLNGATDAIRFAVEHPLVPLLISNIICIAIFLPMWHKMRKSHELYKNDRPVVICLLIVGLFASYNIVQMLVFALTDVIKYFPSYEDISESLVTESFFMQILAIGIAAPIVEEIIYRGILMSRMRWLPIWASVLIQGVLFGAAHLNLFQGLYAFVAGILLGLIYVKFRSLTIVIFGHMAYNLASVLLGEVTSDETFAAVLSLSVFLLPFCAVTTIKHKKAETRRPGQEIMPTAVFAPLDPWD